MISTSQSSHWWHSDRSISSQTTQVKCLVMLSKIGWTYIYSGVKDRFHDQDIRTGSWSVLTSSVMSALSCSREDQFVADPLKEDSASSRGTVRWPKPDSRVNWTTCGSTTPCQQQKDLTTFQNKILRGVEMWYLDLCSKALTLVATIWLSEALGGLSGLVNPQEPEVTAVDVHDRPEVIDLRLGLLHLLVTLLCRHGGCYSHHSIEDERRDLWDQLMMSSPSV